jgi:hypothetical protein
MTYLHVCNCIVLHTDVLVSLSYAFWNTRIKKEVLEHKNYMHMYSFLLFSVWNTRTFQTQKKKNEYIYIYIYIYMHVR